jgi:hypothetical protein
MDKTYNIQYSMAVRRWVGVEQNGVLSKILCVGETPAECFSQLERADGVDMKAVFRVEVKGQAY